MVKVMTTILVELEQKEYLKKNKINLSKLVRQVIKGEMAYGEQGNSRRISRKMGFCQDN